MLVSNIQQNSSQWLERKLDTLSSSEVAAAIGLSRSCTPNSILAHKRLGKDGEVLEQNEAMRLGHEYEQRIGDRVGATMGIQLGIEGMYTSIHHPWLSCSPDRRVLGYYPPWERMYVEIKLKTHGILPEIPEIEHICQIQHQMYVTSSPKPWILLAYSTKDFAMRIFLVRYNASFYEGFVLPRLREFRRAWKEDTTAKLSYVPEVYNWTKERVQSIFTFCVLDPEKMVEQYNALQ